MVVTGAAALSCAGDPEPEAAPVRIELHHGVPSDEGGTVLGEVRDGMELPVYAGAQGSHHFWLIARIDAEPPDEASLSVRFASDGGDILMEYELSIGAADALAPSTATGLFETIPRTIPVARRAVQSREVRLHVALNGWNGSSSVFDGEVVLVETEMPAGLAPDDGALDDGSSAPDHGGSLLPVEFEPEAVLQEAATCAGLFDVVGGPELEIVVVDPARVRVLELDRDSGAWLETTSETGLAQPDTQTGGRGVKVTCAVADLDGDGHPDLVVSSGDDGRVLLGDGSGAFHVVPGAFPALPDHRAVDANRSAPNFPGGIAIVDLDGDGLLDIYVARTKDEIAWQFLEDGCETVGSAVHCGDTNRDYAGLPNVVLRNTGGARFEVVPGTGAEGFHLSQCVGVTDFDSDGRPDLIVCNDAGHQRLYRNLGGMRFDDITDERAADSWGHGMGIATADFDGDGIPEFAISDVGAPLILDRTGGVLDRATERFGLEPMITWGWGIVALDAANDGAIDLAMVTELEETGELAQFGCSECDRWPHAAPVVLYHNDGRGVFEALPAIPGGDRWIRELLSGADDPPDAPFEPTLVAGDIDLDGHVDLLVMWPMSALVAVLWGSDVDHPGVSVQVSLDTDVELCRGERCTRTLVVGAGSYSVARPNRAHFGLGDAAEFTVRTRRLGGSWSAVSDFRTSDLADRPSLIVCGAGGCDWAE